MDILPIRIFDAAGRRELWSMDFDRPPAKDEELRLEPPTGGPVYVRVVRVVWQCQPVDAASNMSALLDGSGYKADPVGWDVYVERVNPLGDGAPTL